MTGLGHPERSRQSAKKPARCAFGFFGKLENDHSRECLFFLGQWYNAGMNRKEAS